MDGAGGTDPPLHPPDISAKHARNAKDLIFKMAPAARVDAATLRLHYNAKLSLFCNIGDRRQSLFQSREKSDPDRSATTLQKVSMFIDTGTSWGWAGRERLHPKFGGPDGRRAYK